MFRTAAKRFALTATAVPVAFLFASAFSDESFLTKSKEFMARLAPTLSATKTAALDTTAGGDLNSNGIVNPGDRLTYKVTITNTGDHPATGLNFSDTIDINTTLVPGSVIASPIAVNDSYSSIGNVGITVPDGGGDLLANDFDANSPGAPALTITVAPTASSQGGQVSINTTTGAFTYNPPPGFEGSDSFTYTLSNGTTLTDTATVTITVSGMIWFVNNSAASCTTIAAGCGRLSNPFSTLAAFQSVNNGTGNNPASGDNIFIYTGGGNYDASVTLLANQRLVGQGANSALAGAASITGIAIPAFSNTLPGTGGTNPTIITTAPATNAINVGSGNTIRGVTVGNTTGAKLNAAANVGTLTIGPASAASDVTLNGNGQAINLIGGGNLLARFASVSSTNSAATGITLTNFGGSFVSPTTTITNPLGIGLNISGSAAGANFNFGNTMANQSGGTGVNLSGNAGAITFADLDIAPDAGFRALQATNSTGALTTTSGTVSVSSAVAVEITNASGTFPLNVQLTSVSANGGTNGVVVTNASATGSPGGFTIAGTGASGTGGTMQNTTISGASFTNAQRISLSWMNFTNANSVDGGGASVCDLGTNVGCNAAIKLSNVTTVNLDRLSINGTAEHGINGRTVSDFSLTNSSILNSGDSGSEFGVSLFELFGTTAAGTENLISGNTISDAGEHVIFVRTSTATNAFPGSPDRLVISGNTISDPGTRNTASGSQGDGITVSLRGTANFQTVVQNNTFNTTETGTDGVQVDAGDTSRSNATITGNNFTGSYTVGGTNIAAYNTAVNVSGSGTSNTVFSITNNPTVTVGVGNAINVASNGDANLQGTISGHTINTPAGLRDGVSSGTNLENAGFGIDMVVDQTGSIVANVTNNVVNGGHMTGFRSTARNGNGGSVDATVTNNTFNSGGAFAQWPVMLMAGNDAAGESVRLCFNLSNNQTATTASFTEHYWMEVWDQPTAGFNNVMQLQGLVPATGATELQVETFVDGTDPSPPPATAPKVEALGAEVINYVHANCSQPSAFAALNNYDSNKAGERYASTQLENNLVSPTDTSHLPTEMDIPALGNDSPTLVHIFPTPGKGFPTPGKGFPTPGISFPTPGISFPTPGKRFPTLGIGFLTLGKGFPTDEIDIPARGNYSPTEMPPGPGPQAAEPGETKFAKSGVEADGGNPGFVGGVLTSTGEFMSKLRAAILPTVSANESVPNPDGSLNPFSGETVTKPLGTLPPGEQIVVQFKVTIDANIPANDFSVANTAQISASNHATINSTTATTTVVQPASISKAFGASFVTLGNTTTLTFTINNGNASQLTNVAFTDPLPSGLRVADAPSVINNCVNGTVTAVANATSIGYSGGTRSASSSCTIVVNVKGVSEGVQNNVTGAITSLEGGTGNTASASILVVNAPVVGKSFTPSSIPLNTTSTLGITIQNPNTSQAFNGVSFTDTLPAGVTAPDATSSACGGTLQVASNVITLSGASVAAGTTCTVNVTVTGTSAGTKNNVVTVSTTNAGTNYMANATLTVVAPPTIAKSFAPNTILLNETSILTISTTNPAGNTVALTGVGVVDSLPAGMEVDAAPNATNSCSTGSFAPTAGSTSISISGATIPVGTTCNFSVRVRATTTGAKVNTTDNVQSGNGGAGGTATATLNVGNTVTWTGATSTDWNVATNWNPAVVPAPSNAVLIPSTGVTNEPTIPTAGPDITVSGLTVESGRVLTVASGRTLTVNGAVTDDGTINVAGNLAATSVSATGAVNFSGTAPQTVPTGVYNNMTVNNAAGVSLIGNTDIGGNLTLQNGIVNAGDFTLNFTATGGATRAGACTIVSCFVANNPNAGGVRKQFGPGATAAFVYPVGTSGGTDNGYSPVELANISAASAGDSLTVRAVDAVSPATIPSEKITRYWDLTETGDITTDITFRYLSGDDDAVTVPASLRVFRGSGSVCSTDCVDEANLSGTATGVTEFSPWTMAAMVPTAANVSITGRVLTTNGRGINKARLILIDANGNIRHAVTNPFGYYRFFDVAAGETYILSVSSKRYTFAQPTMVLNVLDELTDVNFVGEH